MTTNSTSSLRSISEEGLKGERLCGITGGRGDGYLGKKAIPDPEVCAKATRRKFSASYKLRIVEAADRYEHVGEIGAFLRKEGLYSSQLCQWRKLRDSGALKALKGKIRGRKRKPVNPLMAEVERLLKEKAQLEGKLRQAELIIEFQKKAAEILELPLMNHERSE